ncbi:hypothetical protein MRX96_043755 [Rhipicephalus microplus]
MLQSPLIGGQQQFNLDVRDLIWQEHMLDAIPDPPLYPRRVERCRKLSTSGGSVKGRSATPPEAGRNLRPPGWNKIVLPVFHKNLYREHIVTAGRSASEVDGYRKDNNITVAGRAIPKPILSFEEAGFPDIVTQVFLAQGLGSSPTSVQSQCWPVIRSGRDLLAVVPISSENKFMAYVIQAVRHVHSQNSVQLGDGPTVLVLASTRELALQVQQTFRHFEKDSGVRTACLLPGESKQAQLTQLEKECEVWVTTPSRLVALMEECKVNIGRCTFLVLDEVDRMLEMGLGKNIRLIVENVRPDHQTIMWLTSNTREACQLADEVMEDYVTISFGDTSQQSQNRRAQHIVHVCDEGDKEDRLVALFEDILDNKQDKAVVFVETKGKVDHLVTSLRLRNWPVVGVHSKKSDQERELALNAFRFGRVLVLVATDMVVRDLEAQDVRFVVNYDYPRSADDYALRVKPAVRDDGTGRAYTFLTPTQSRHAKELIWILRDARQVVPQEVLNVARKTTRF